MRIPALVLGCLVALAVAGGSGCGGPASPPAAEAPRAAAPPAPPTPPIGAPGQSASVEPPSGYLGVVLPRQAIDVAASAGRRVAGAAGPGGDAGDCATRG